jgi:hypothetical protein
MTKNADPWMTTEDIAQPTYLPTDRSKRSQMGGRTCYLRPGRLLDRRPRGGPPRLRCPRVGEVEIWWELATLITIMVLGPWLEMRSIAQARGALTALAELLPDTAERVTGAATETVPLSELAVGDIVLVRPGARVPADGVVADGSADVDEPMITGESTTVAKEPGDKVVAGTVAAGGSLRVRVSAVGEGTGAAGLSLATGPHALTLGAAPFRRWCAYDALGIAAALGVDALVETACGQCGAPIRVEFQGGVPDRADPERLWLADGGDDLRGSFCTPTVLLCGDAHGAVWAEREAGRGRLLDLAEGARLGGSEWAGCAEARRKLA